MRRLLARSLPAAVAALLLACGPSGDATRDQDPSSGSPAASEAPGSPRVASDTAPGPEGPADSASSGTSVADPAVGPGPRVLFLGTSLTAGLGVVRDTEAYPARLDAMADSAGVPIRAVNAGVSGETSAGGLRRLDWLLEDSVDVLFLELGANDGLRGQDPAALEDNLRAIVRRTRKAWPDARVVLAGLEAPPNLGPRYTRDFRAVFPRVAEETGAALVPFLLEGVAGVPTLNQEDGIHPTPEGHARMARTAWPVLERVLRAERAAEAGS